MNKLLFLILLISFFVRIVGLNTSPPSMFSDEVDMGVQARSILTTGKDYLGSQSLFYVRSYNSDRTPLPVYLVTISTKLLSNPLLQVKMPFILTGVLIVFVTFQIIYLTTKSKSAAFWGALVAALNPWQIQFSRLAFESIIALGVTMMAVWLFLLWFDKKSKLLIFLSFIFFGIGVYSYRTMSLFSPLLLLTLIFIFYKEFFKQSKLQISILAIIFLILYGSFIYKTVLVTNDQTRISQISIFSDPAVPIWVQRNREIDSGDLTDSTIGKKAAGSSFLFHNKYLSWIESFKNNYLESFSTNFLFVSGDPNLRHSPDGGLMLLPDLLGFVFGMVFVLSNFKSNKKVLFLLSWLVLSSIPSSLTTDGGGGHHASRLLLLSTPLLIIVGIGWWKIVSNKKILSLVLIIYALSFSFYYHHYLTHYPIKAARSFGYGYKESFEEIRRIGKKENFDVLKLSTSIDPPLPYLWFWTPGTIEGIGTVETMIWPVAIKERELYLLTERDINRDVLKKEVDEGRIRLLSTIKYPDNEPAFYILTKDIWGSSQR